MLSGLVVDNFAGGGGASTGIERAIGRPVDFAINHDPEAIAVHKANHPETRHFCENIWEVDPHEACGGRPVDLAWFSPDCTHFSRAKGTAPLKKEIRGLAWVVIRWAKAVAPRVIILENVEEFQTWGPLADNQRPDPARVGETFRQWLGELTGSGYTLDFRTLIAADYGAPTTRKRLFLIARRDGSQAIWPEATHGRGRARPWRPAAEIIDWSLPCPSIFDRKRPLAEATLRRIATGIRRYVVENADPFIVPVKSWGGGGNGPRSIDLPMRTVTASKRGEFALVEPFVVRHGHYSTKTGAGLIEGRGAGTFRGQRLRDPLATVCATNDKHLVCPLVTKHYGGPNGHPAVGHAIDDTLGTVTARDHHALTAALLVKNNFGVKPCLGVDEPLHTVTTQHNKFAHVAAFLTKFYGTSVGQQLELPMPTVTGQGQHLAEVRAFLMKYYGTGGQAQAVDDPLHTVTAKARFGLAYVYGEPYQIVDIGMRMLQPRELFNAQGFPLDYDIAPELNGKPLTKEAQIKLAGNSVCPDVAEALVVANIFSGEAAAA